ncbi:MAG: HmuY family protein [Niabella sp.]
MNVNRIKKGAVAVLILAAIASCKKDKPFTELKPIEGTLVAEVGEELRNQIYLDLSEGKAVTIPVNAWDIAFESNGGFAVKVNSAKKSGVWNTGQTDFSTVTAPSTTPGAFKFDDVANETSGTAIGAWGSNGVSDKKVYVINLGLNPPSSTTNIGYKKFIIEGFTNNTYTLRYANMDGSGEKTVQIPVNKNKNYTYYSMQTDAVVEIEPDKGKWDLLISGYTRPGGGPPPYSFVISVGALVNTYGGVRVAVDNPGKDLEDSDDPEAPVNTFPSSNSRYDQITVADYASLQPSSSPVSIGSDWYTILQPHRNGNYKIYDWKTYIVKDVDGRYFKMKFLAYKGGPNITKGYPTFEYKEIR